MIFAICMWVWIFSALGFAVMGFMGLISGGEALSWVASVLVIVGFIGAIAGNYIS